ncbi:MMPL family transporter [Corynebacterium sp. 320]|nr:MULTISPECIES: MMPL family transporter [Corynebacterium]KAB1503193.1 MMPL family transporter [Corynebacterium sp. 320]KAB1550594.1 MMPL family transporter [Corynebacterium sp. 321]KAB1550955.1 MMPL family transporter [Corynebacterium sp. 319]KAB3526990.1 MMPL family transporter [Corynebacterium sp. 250]KAB3538482.1 MMPL family transporter [Corynebacterium sp. 366]
MFTTWGDIAYRFRRLIPLVIITGILILYGIFGTQLGSRMSQEGWDDPNSESTRAAVIEQNTFGRDDDGDVIVLVTSTTPGGAVTEEVKASMTEQLEALKAKYPDQIASIRSFFHRGPAQMANADGTAAFAAVSLKGVEDDVLKNYRVIEDDLHAISLDGAAPGAPQDTPTVQIAGATAVSGALDSGMAGDISRAEVYALPAVGVLLLLVFGGVIAALMPLLVGVLSILGAMGVLSILASLTQINVFAQSVVTLLGLGLAIDYGLFMVSRFREELAEGADVQTAVRNTTASAGKTVVFSALMVAVALSGLLIFPQAFLKSVAFGAMSAVGLAALFSVAVLPSIFAMLGHNIDKWAIRKNHKRRSELFFSTWGKIPQFAMKHSKKVVFVVVVGLIALAAPIAGIKLGGINETFLPPDNSTRVAQQDFNQAFPDFRTDPIKLVISGDPSAISPVYQQANQVKGLSSPFKVSQPTKDNVTVLSAGIANRDDYGRVVRELEAIEADGAEVLVAGTPALEQESIGALFQKLPWMLLYIVVVSFLLMALIFGSLIIPAKAVIMNILGTGATLGLLTLLFVDGVGSDLFNFTAGPLMSPVLVLIVAIIFGLSTDYEVFLVSRMVEARKRGATTDTAIRFGTATTGGIITAAALIMIVVCGAFGFSTIVMMKYIAFGMVIALILDATIIRMLLVPAIMHLLGADNWWAPAAVKKASEKLGHE